MRTYAVKTGGAVAKMNPQRPNSATEELGGSIFESRIIEKTCEERIGAIQTLDTFKQ
jgi:hypothetical protein